ncbi:uncharacterized protein C227.17c-like isoform X3 [Olea europaea var. sylvestris]|uniref:uncharacterized protein C227.17c-like isoform X3 n=1 Tax=Olea europaea var. sylvestris TaxID=158386 RepID=UPI000C1D86B4|nr:uncharacterized protein C227.17c-like isoform X3 [Olea europaea var. sylvestris]
MSLEKEEGAATRRRLSCTKYFDALWFCYSPVHQMQQYYRLGDLDNCSGKWTALVDCLSLKTKRSSELETPKVICCSVRLHLIFMLLERPKMKL